jgi:thiol-disulfide isomerase/thioredoxin
LVLNIRKLRPTSFFKTHVIQLGRLTTSLLLLFLATQTWAQMAFVYDVNGNAHSDESLRKGKTTVYFFISPECPLCQSYSLTMRTLHTQYAAKGIEFVGIVPGNDFDEMDIVTYKNKYKIPFKMWRDSKMELTSKYNATITPEAIVVDAKGKALYQGRIDNWAYELGKKRKVITEHDLINALDLILANKPVKVSKTKAIGCYIE